MMKRIVLITLLLVIAFNAFPGESSAFWWLFKKKVELPVLPPPSYTISCSEYRHDYGDAVRVTGSDNEFVICEACPKSTALERLPKPVTIVIKTTTPTLPVAVETIPMKPIEAIPSGISPRPEHAPSSAAVNSDVMQVQQSAPTSTTIEHQRTTTVYFPLNSSFISQTEKQKILDALGSLKGRDIKVTGYTCELGSKEHNDRLALSRARAVAGILETSGIKPTAVSGEGKCCYISGDKEMNRRAEIREIDRKEGL
jgi:outer membrane protein OmpA-like peptidoglycan-associated protein